jgi:hypothetical protein
MNTATKNLASALRLRGGPAQDDQVFFSRYWGNMKQQQNVVNLGDWQESREIRLKNEVYSRYLQTLPNAQLEIEIGHLIRGPEINLFSKAQLVMKEIGSRAHEDVRSKIEKFHQDST